MGLQKLIKTTTQHESLRVVVTLLFVESLSIFVEKVLYDTVRYLPSRINDTGNMLDIIDKISNSNLPTNSIIVGFDIVNTFPSIDN